ncbi:MAG TPA: protein phosphatase 2C domain-containing protein [Polyangiaceae bacterium]
MPPSTFFPEPHALDVGALSDAGTERGINEDHCATLIDGSTSALVVVADGVSGAEGGDTASRTAVESLLLAYREQPSTIPSAKRLYRAAQRANIAVYDLALVVPELRGMSTTLTALSIDRGELSTVHVGDSRLYLIRSGRVQQLTKDHTVTAARTRLGLLSKQRARTHKDRSTLTRSLGRDLVASLDRITTRVEQGDMLIACSDGLYNVLDEKHMAELVGDLDATAACRALVDRANQRGTPDNLTAAVVRIVGATPVPPRRSLLAAALSRLSRG